MAPKTIKSALVEMLQDLSTENFNLFCCHLKDRREEPTVRVSEVENKTRLELADLLVSRFTEAGSPRVALEILRRIGCNEEAERLNSKIKHCGAKGEPTFRRTSNRLLDTKPLREAQKSAAEEGTSVKSPAEVEAEAKAIVLSEGGDISNEALVLSRHTIQFGMHKGRTFKWLLENDVRYVAWLLAQPKMHGRGSTFQNLKANKESLARYANAHPEVLKEVPIQRVYTRAKENSLWPGQEGKALVGFGCFKSETLQNLYDSKDEKKISYVNFLRKQQLNCDRGSRMEAAVNYILMRDQKEAAGRRRKPRTK